MQNVLERVVKYSIYALVLLTPLFWLPFSFEAFEYNKQYLLFFLVSLGFFAWLAKQVIYDKEVKFRKSPIDYLVLGFLLISLISAIFSVDGNSSFFGFYGRFSNGLIGLLGFGILYFLITNNVSIEERSPKISAGKLLSSLLYSAAAVVAVAYLSIFGIWQKLGFLQIVQQKTFNPVAGSLEGLSVFLSIMIVLLSGLMLNKTRSVLYWILLPASLGLMMIIDFTPAWIILLATLVLFVGVSLAKRIFKENVNQLLIPIVLIIISAVFIFLQPIKMNLPQEQVLPQAISWQVGLQAATDNFKNGLVGSGLSTFHYDFAAYKPQSFNQNWMWQIRFDRAGSYFAELLATTGFLGFLVYLGFIGLVLLISWFFVARNFSGFPLVMAFIALLAGQLVYYQNTSLAFMFWLVLGLSVVSWQAAKAEPIQEKKFSFKSFPELALMFLTLTIILGVAFLSFYFYAIKYYLADANYSKALFSLGEERTKILERAVKLNPQSPHYRTVLARSYLAELLDEAQKTSQDQAKIQLLVAKSIDQARAATILSKNQVAYWETLGVIYREIQGMAVGANDWGKKSFEEAIKLEPTNPVLYTELGKLYLTAGDKEKAKENFSKALEKKQDYVTATIQLALLLEQDNILDEAMLKLEKLIEVNPYNIEGRFQLGRLYFNNGRINDAIEQFKVVTILVPNHSNAHYSLGVAYAANRETQLAIQEFEKVLELNPGNEDVMQKLESLR